MQELLTYILQNLIADNFTLETIEEENRVTFNVKVDPEKAGLIIGKGGRIIKSIQDILRIKATLLKKFVYVNISTE